MHLPRFLGLRLLLLTPELVLMVLGVTLPEVESGNTRLGSFLPPLTDIPQSEKDRNDKIYTDHMETLAELNSVRGSKPRAKYGKRDVNHDGSTFLWTLLDTYAGKTFFE